MVAGTRGWIVGHYRHELRKKNFKKRTSKKELQINRETFH